MNAKQLKQYFRRTWIIYSLLGVYILLLVLNAAGFDTWLPGCLVTKITGYSCLGCGLNRAAMHLLLFDFEEAFVANPLIFLYVPLIIGVIFYDFYNFRDKLNQQPIR